ncbi:MAG TPA: hypothetical protein V6D23_08720, partial [Candidatus Obscuribacterales bacterium]
MRQRLLTDLGERILALPAAWVQRIAIDGVDGAGKTTFADQLAALISPLRTVIRAGVDGFHQPRALRYSRGRTSPEGFYLDSYDYPGLIAALLAPLSPGGSGHYRSALFDHHSDSPVALPPATASPDAILLFDGIFLHRPELIGFWDFSIFLEVDFAVSIPRGAQRGMGSPDPAAASNRRYIEGQKLYLQACQPQRHASLVID